MIYREEKQLKSKEVNKSTPVDEKTDLLVVAANNRLKDIDKEVDEWCRQQNPNLDVDYYIRKRKKRFKNEAREIYAIELFLALKDPALIENHMSVT
ncbi:hypothetical protein HY989_02375 [Candidatus Micrarchaeota archaeon]|nr:hypothetical protein [Candidatus Micrarchaeota archaeon]